MDRACSTNGRLAMGVRLIGNTLQRLIELLPRTPAARRRSSSARESPFHSSTRLRYDGDDTELRRFEALDPSLFGAPTREIAPQRKARGGQIVQLSGESGETRCEEGDLNPKRRPKT